MVYIKRKLSTVFKFSNLLEYKLKSLSLWFSGFPWFALYAPLVFLILLDWMFVLPIFVNLRKCYSILLSFSMNQLFSFVAHAQQARKNDAATGSFCTHLFSPVSSFSIYLPCLYISLVFISPPNPGPLTLLYSLSVPIHAQQATPPHQARSFS